MDNWVQQIFQDHRILAEKLLEVGFQKQGETFFLQKTLPNCGFLLTVQVKDGEISTEVTDPATGEPYTLYLYDGATGSFVGEVRSLVEDTLKEIRQQCCVPDAFRAPQTKALLAFVYKKYGSAPEFLWEKFSNNAILRRKDTGKWYGLLVADTREKFGLAGKGSAEILVFRAKPEELSALVVESGFLPAYHMNKKSWCGVILDGTVTFQKICELVETSFGLAKK